MTQTTTDDITKAAKERVLKRLERLNRLTFLAQSFTPEELEGLIRLAEAGHARRGALAKIDDGTVATSVIAGVILWPTEADSTEDEEWSCLDCGWTGTGAHACQGRPGEPVDETIEW